MDMWLADRVAEIRTRLMPGDEGSLWILWLDGPQGEPVLACGIEGAMAELDDELVKNLATTIEEVGAAAVLLAVPRRVGVPDAVDRRLWSELRAQVRASVKIVDLVVVGKSQHWSACRGGRTASIASGCPEDPV